MLWFHQSPFIVLVHGVEVLEGGRGVGRSRVYNRSLLKRQVQYNQVFGREIHSRTESQLGLCFHGFCVCRYGGLTMGLQHPGILVFPVGPGTDPCGYQVTTVPLKMPVFIVRQAFCWVQVWQQRSSLTLWGAHEIVEDSDVETTLLQVDVCVCVCPGV